MPRVVEYLSCSVAVLDTNTVPCIGGSVVPPCYATWLAEGILDFPQRLLGRCDWVVDDNGPIRKGVHRHPRVHLDRWDNVQRLS